MKRVRKSTMMLGLLVIASVVGTAAHANPGMMSGAGQHGAAGTTGATGGSRMTGKVVETMAGGGYTYALLEKNGKKQWVAMPETKIALGQELTFADAIEMRNFKSKALGRSFDQIWFCNNPIAKKGGEEDGAMAGKVSTGSTGAVVEPADKVQVEKAVGKDACTVEEAYRNSEALDTKPVMVRGKVVKFSEGIMNKNWVHLQDGSGDPKARTNNLVVTTQDVAKVGDVVTITGTLYKDKDFGSGYRYEVIVEEAKVSQQ